MQIKYILFVLELIDVEHNFYRHCIKLSFYPSFPINSKIFDTKNLHQLSAESSIFYFIRYTYFRFTTYIHAYIPSSSINTQNLMTAAAFVFIKNVGLFALQPVAEQEQNFLDHSYVRPS